MVTQKQTVPQLLKAYRSIYSDWDRRGQKIEKLEARVALGEKLADEVINVAHAQSSGERALQLAREFQKQGRE